MGTGASNQETPLTAATRDPDDASFCRRCANLCHWSATLRHIRRDIPPRRRWAARHATFCRTDNPYPDAGGSIDDPHYCALFAPTPPGDDPR